MRWRLAAPHYLQVPGTEWEYKEIDRTTGKPKRHMFPVPLLLDPSQPTDWTHRHNADEGEIIVCYKDKGEPKDIVFIGEPTPDMVPIDEEAKALSAKYEAKWKHPIESLSGSFSEKILDDLQREVVAVKIKQNSNETVGMTELLTAMAAMMKQNQEMMATLVGGAAKPTEAPIARRA